ncbi:MAG: hypothetical protein AAFR26_18900, partial [Cyanobacteria bacterium J06626_4]
MIECSVSGGFIEAADNRMNSVVRYTILSNDEFVGVSKKIACALKLVVTILHEEIRNLNIFFPLKLYLGLSIVDRMTRRQGFEKLKNFLKKEKSKLSLSFCKNYSKQLCRV